jgi:hypothetical protein
MKQNIKILGGAYVLGIWIYGLWYVGENWEGAKQIGTLAGHAIMRAVVWPWWVVQGLMQG